jgi:hypothetical protein
MADNLTSQLKIFYEQRPARLSDFTNVMFPTRRVFASEVIPVDRIIPTGALAGYRERGAASNVLPYNPGTGIVGRPPIIAVKTPVTEDLAAQNTVGSEVNAPANEQLLRKYAFIQDQQAEAIYATIAKQAADILSLGSFTPIDSVGNVVGEVVDFQRDPSLTHAENYSAAGGAVKQITAAYTALKKFGVPSTGLFVLVGSMVMARLQTDADFMNLLQIQGLNAGRQYVSPDNRVVGTILSNALMPGFAVPMTILSFDETYLGPGGARQTFISPLSVIVSSFNTERYQCYGGVYIGDGQTMSAQIYAGEIVSDRFFSKDPDTLLLRSQSRPLLIPANVNHTACFTSTS